MSAEKLRPQTERTAYFDWLRVAAALAVMMIHVCAQHWYDTDVNGAAWRSFDVIDSLASCAVPIFVMISGALFLNREIPLSKLLSKYCLRMLAAYFFWSLIHALFEAKSPAAAVALTLRGHFHMWFLPMIIGLYLCVPLFRALTEEEGRVRYFLLLAGIFAFLIPWLFNLFKDFAPPRIGRLVGDAYSFVNKMKPQFVLGYTAFFLGGWYLDRLSLSRKQRGWIYVLGLLGWVCTIFLNAASARKTGRANTKYVENFAPAMLAEAVAVFTWFKYHVSGEKGSALVGKLARYSFGAYLAHVLVLDRLDEWLGLNTLRFHPLLAVPAVWACVAVLSFGISAVLHQIPFVKKYFV